MSQPADFAAALDAIITDADLRRELDRAPEATLAKLGFAGEAKPELPTESRFAPPYVPVGAAEKHAMVAPPYVPVGAPEKHAMVAPPYVPVGRTDKPAMVAPPYVPVGRSDRR